MCGRSVSVSVTPSCWIRQSLLQRGHEGQLILQGSDQSVGSSEYDIKERSNSSGPHPRMFCLCSPLWWSGDPDGRSNWKRRVGKILAGGTWQIRTGWRRKLVSHILLPGFTIRLLFSLIVLFVLSSFHGIFLAESRFSPEGRWFSRNSGCQDVTLPPQIWEVALLKGRVNG
jgi:hypothetical protein